MNGIEMAVELQRPARFAAVEADDDGRRGRVIGGRAFDREAVRLQQASQTVGDGAALAGAAGNGDQLLGRVEQTLFLDRLAQTIRDGKIGVHDGGL